MVKCNSGLSQAAQLPSRHIEFRTSCLKRAYGLERYPNTLKSAGFPRVLEAFADILKSSPANMIQLDRSPALARFIWRGLDHFRAYVWSSVVAYNLALFARLKPT